MTPPPAAGSWEATQSAAGVKSRWLNVRFLFSSRSRPLFSLSGCCFALAEVPRYVFLAFTRSSCFVLYELCLVCLMSGMLQVFVSLLVVTFSCFHLFLCCAFSYAVRRHFIHYCKKCGVLSKFRAFFSFPKSGCHYDEGVHLFIFLSFVTEFRYWIGMGLL